MTELKYYNIDQLVEHPNYPFSIGQLRDYVAHRHENGLNVAIRKIGKRLYFRLDLFNDWIESHQK